MKTNQARDMAAYDRHSTVLNQYNGWSLHDDRAAGTHREHEKGQISPQNASPMNINGITWYF